MYLKHFNLEQYPFTITPDTEFFFNYGVHKEAIDVLECALFSGEGFVKVTGEVGTGKTILCRKLLSSLGEDFVTVYIPNPSINPEELRRALAGELGVECANFVDQDRLLGLINTRLMQLHADGKQVVLFLDEAQAMPDDSIEALRLLSNLETEKCKLLQIVLFGQPELDTRLQQDNLRQVRQRILFSYKLTPLAPNSLDIYLMHRLNIAGYVGPQLFTPQALKRLQRCSRGIPRLVNILAHKAMMVAYGQGESGVGSAHIRKAVLDTEDTQPTHRRLPLAFSLATLTTAGIYAVWH